MAVASAPFWPQQEASRQQQPPAQSSGPRQQDVSNVMGSTAYAQGQYPQPSLQLESFHDQVGFDSLNALPYHSMLSPNSQSNMPLVPHTATSLAARNASARPYNYNNLTGTGDHLGTSPASTIAGSESFSPNFTFTSPSQMSAMVRDHVSPHEMPGSRRQHQHPDYASAQSNTMLQSSFMKRAREDTLETSLSGEEDDFGNEQYPGASLGFVGEGYDSYPPLAGEGSTSNIQHHGAPHTTGHVQAGDAQLGSDGKPKQSVFWPCSNGTHHS